MYRRYRELCDKVYDTLHATAGKRRMDNFKRNVAEKGSNELTRERNRLQNVLDAKKQDIQNYETNLTFFRSSSKRVTLLWLTSKRKLNASRMT